MVLWLEQHLCLSALPNQPLNEDRSVLLLHCTPRKMDYCICPLACRLLPSHVSISPSTPNRLAVDSGTPVGCLLGFSAQCVLHVVILVWQSPMFQGRRTPPPTHTHTQTPPHLHLSKLSLTPGMSKRSWRWLCPRKRVSTFTVVLNLTEKRELWETGSDATVFLLQDVW